MFQEAKDEQSDLSFILKPNFIKNRNVGGEN